MTRQTPAEAQAAFWRFHLTHPEVYDTLETIIWRWVAAPGHPPRWSIWAAYQVARWERRIRGLPDMGEAFKLSNNYTTFYSRLITARNPDWADVFVQKVAPLAVGFDPLRPPRLEDLT